MQFYEQALSRYNQTTADPKKKNYFEITLTLVLLIVLLIMIYPAITHILNLNKEIQAGKIIDKALTKKLEDLALAQNNLAEVEENLPLLELALPIGSDIDKYLKDPIEGLANKNELSLKSVQFNDVPVSKPETEDVKQREMTFTLNLTGGFPNLLGFVKDMENFVRVTNLESFQLKSSGTELTITVQGSTNYLGTPIAIPNQATSGGTQ